MTPEQFFTFATYVSFTLLILAFLLTILRLIAGPTLADRILSLDMLVTLGIGFIAVVTVSTGYFEYLDVAIALGLIGFLATVAFARFVLHSGAKGDKGLLDDRHIDSDHISGSDSNV